MIHAKREVGSVAASALPLALLLAVALGLRLLVWRHLRSIRDNPLLCRLMFREVRSEADYHGSGLHQLNRQYTELLVQVLDQGQQSGEIRRDVPLPLLRDMVYGAIEHHTWNFICGRGALDIDHIAEQMTAMLCDGIATQAIKPVARMKSGSRSPTSSKPPGLHPGYRKAL